MALTQDRSKGRRDESSTQQQRCQTIRLFSQRGVQAEAKRARLQRAGGGRADGAAEWIEQSSTIKLGVVLRVCVLKVCVCVWLALSGFCVCGVWECVCVVWSRRALSTQERESAHFSTPQALAQKTAKKSPRPFSPSLSPISFSLTLSTPSSK